MKVERNIFFGLGLFYAFACSLYAYMAREVVGIFVLALSALLAFMIAGYMLVEGRKNDEPLADVADAQISQGAGTLGFFPPHSIWPFWAALTVAVIALGPVFGWWLTVLGFGMGIWSVSGWVFEYYRGDYAH
ncbi:MAG TPA: cytochrome c oxidase subunit 4 [Candidatus Luteococcus avicola]|nr:cytochrome c oxidase subunit 4 [Candidatus Luteococcus avicola]